MGHLWRLNLWAGKEAAPCPFTEMNSVETLILFLLSVRSWFMAPNPPSHSALDIGRRWWAFSSNSLLWHHGLEEDELWPHWRESWEWLDVCHLHVGLRSSSSDGQFDGFSAVAVEIILSSSLRSMLSAWEGKNCLRKTSAFTFTTLNVWTLSDYSFRHLVFTPSACRIDLSFLSATPTSALALTAVASFLWTNRDKACRVAVTRHLAFSTVDLNLSPVNVKSLIKAGRLSLRAVTDVQDLVLIFWHESEECGCSPASASHSGVQQAESVSCLQRDALRIKAL